jgi:hypothetical protein
MIGIAANRGDGDGGRTEPLPHAPELVQARTCRREGELGIEGHKRERADAIRERCLDSFFDERVPVAHADVDAAVQMRAQLALQELSLTRGPLRQRRSASDVRVVAGDSAGAQLRDRPRQRTLSPSAQRHAENIGIGEEVAKKRFHGTQRIWPAQVEQENPMLGHSSGHTVREKIGRSRIIRSRCASKHMAILRMTSRPRSVTVSFSAVIRSRPSAMNSSNFGKTSAK